MSFVYEEVPVEDIEFLRTRGFKNCWGSDPKLFGGINEFWSVNREKSVCLVKIGGGMHDIPLTADLWWEGSIVRIEYHNGGTSGNGVVGVNFVSNIMKIIVPKKLWDKRDEVVALVRQGFSVIYWATDAKDTKSITVKIACQPELATERDVYGS